MCGSCGCADGEGATILDLQTGRRTPLERPAHPASAHSHGHRHGDHGEGHAHSHAHSDGNTHSHAHPHDGDLTHNHAHTHGDGHTHGHAHAHGDGRAHGHDHVHGPRGHGPGTHSPAPASIDLERRILAHNDTQAGLNRAWLAGREILALNLVSSPGAGKTTLIERTIRDLKAEMPIGVIEGDQATSNDGERIRKAGAPAIQVNTGSGCHLEADMVDRALRALKPPAGSLVIIENVGNLVCPALFDLGERAKVAIFSVTEGEDKPLKYPHIFAAAEVLIINKTDLLPHVDFDLALAIANARHVNPGVTIFEVSARTGEGLMRWYDWLRTQTLSAREAAFI